MHRKMHFWPSSTSEPLEAFIAHRRPYWIERPTSKEGEVEPTSKGMGGKRGRRGREWPFPSSENMLLHTNNRPYLGNGAR